MEIRLVILFLSRKKFHAKLIFVLTRFMKLGPALIMTTQPPFNNSKKLLSTHLIETACNIWGAIHSGTQADEATMKPTQKHGGHHNKTTAITTKPSRHKKAHAFESKLNIKH